MVQHKGILTMADRQKVAYDLSNGALFNDLERPVPRFQGHSIFDAEYLSNGTRYRHSFNRILIGIWPTHALLNVVSSNDLE